MSTSHKLLFNTIALYGRIIVSAIVSIVGTRIVLKELGVDAYGLYNLIAGVIVLLSFLNGALMISTQRFLSLVIGQGDNKKLNNVFNVSFAIHFCLGLAVVVCLNLIRPLLFDLVLKIPEVLMVDAVIIYNIMIVTSFFTIIMIPYSAVLNAREDMVFFAGAEIVSLLFRLVAAVSLLYVDNNKLIIYTLLMLLALLINVALKYIRCYIKYNEIKLVFKGWLNQKELFSEMSGFIGWNTLGSVAVLVRGQGVAVLLNAFFGTTINAAYGVSSQVNALVMSFAMALTNVFAPSIIRSKGEGNDKKMLDIAIFSSKLSFLLSSAVALPLLVFTPVILDVWLDVIPVYTVEFCRLSIISFLIIQLIPGINRAIYANGQIKWYQIFLSVFMISILPVGYVVFRLTNRPQDVFILIIISQVLTVILTILLSNKYNGLRLKSFIQNSIVKPVVCFILLLIFMFFVQKSIYQVESLIGIIISSVIYSLLYLGIFAYVVFEKNEIQKIKELVLKIIK